MAGELPPREGSRKSTGSLAGETGMTLLAGKVAIVTGASRGVGAAAALALAKAGASVMLGARDAARLAKVAADITASGGKAVSMACDMSDYAAVERLVAETEARLGPVDVLVNNAGVIEPIAPIWEADPAVWARNIEVNLVGCFNGVRAVLARMIAGGGGTIINVSSGAGVRPLEGWSAYSSGKAGLAMLTRAIALEAGDKNIRVYGFSPGTTDTDMQAAIRESGMNIISQIPREKLTPVEVPAQAIVYLATPAAADLSGKEVTLRDETFLARVGLS
jgi:3-oxoacyl-[acyl-carrier protein] reductase